MFGKFNPSLMLAAVPIMMASSTPAKAAAYFDQLGVSQCYNHGTATERCSVGGFDAGSQGDHNDHWVYSYVVPHCACEVGSVFATFHTSQMSGAAFVSAGPVVGYLSIWENAHLSVGSRSGSNGADEYASFGVTLT